MYRYIQPQLQLMIELEEKKQRRDQKGHVGVRVSLANLAPFFLNMPGWQFPWHPHKGFTTINIPLVRRKYPHL